MNRFVLRIVACSVFTLVMAPGYCRAQTGNCGKLAGTWRLVSAIQNGEARKDVGKTQTQLKHVTDTQFTWVLFDNETKVIAMSLGGSCSMMADTYTETPEYGLGEVLAPLKGKEQRFTIKLNGDRWHLKGKLSEGTELEEVWERMKR